MNDGQPKAEKHCSSMRRRFLTAELSDEEAERIASSLARLVKAKCLPANMPARARLSATTRALCGRATRPWRIG